MTGVRRAIAGRVPGICRAFAGREPGHCPAFAGWLQASPRFEGVLVGVVIHTGKKIIAAGEKFVGILISTHDVANAISWLEVDARPRGSSCELPGKSPIASRGHIFEPFRQLTKVTCEPRKYAELV